VLKAIQQEQAQRSSVPQNRPAAKQRSSPPSNEAIPNQ
jgi:hypothetical protein